MHDKRRIHDDGGNRLRQQHFSMGKKRTQAQREAERERERERVIQRKNSHRTQKASHTETNVEKPNEQKRISPKLFICARE